MKSFKSIETLKNTCLLNSNITFISRLDLIDFKECVSSLQFLIRQIILDCILDIVNTKLWRFQVPLFSSDESCFSFFPGCNFLTGLEMQTLFLGCRSSLSADLLSSRAAFSVFCAEVVQGLIRDLAWGSPLGLFPSWVPLLFQHSWFPGFTFLIPRNRKSLEFLVYVSLLLKPLV